ncbi:type II toxin-antitoxin system RelE/ParE family toxin [Dyadobacter chenwenxiniae]|uniref:Type II toxin-antitoxin system RelE/ParE family toxin n=1 Tax=Dyadobacter chenwenxiniae TaxID=2906456 RepID=A0A9X1PQD1_9BACT|nr:type II toxin-antitoxin system RelE/ParE family toxin [Dyadobacter chenwenxiniae]MCF0065505.1 type II toxin-antitoxin system RelE/ParE family toxin [Dyadobacter chenwenxiniae]UON82087.1 type II toxin-antitoxin system RelE/ParE family toxin [Dyadobacter chenwenxiniae]
MYKLIFTNRALKSLKAISKRDASQILEKLEELSADPIDARNVKRLQNHPIAVFRLRIGDYRVLFDKEDALRIIEIIDIGHRKHIY